MNWQPFLQTLSTKFNRKITILYNLQTNRAWSFSFLSSISQDGRTSMGWSWSTIPRCRSTTGEYGRSEYPISNRSNSWFKNDSGGTTTDSCVGELSDGINHCIPSFVSRYICSGRFVRYDSSGHIRIRSSSSCSSNCLTQYESIHRSVSSQCLLY